MKRLAEQRYLLRQNLIAVIGLCLSVYFCYHLIAGERGFLRKISLERQIETLASTQDSLLQERQALEKKVKMMRPGSVNRDLLEERVRSVLGYTHEDEKVLLQSRS
ncbi:MAG: septum formation initiator family protein [Rhodospirillales bacterium]|nr:septum formation initiator family protein [Alphaproteobacteria bacterium]USO03328.1 MAG: septum formation initiator family protein [Rhodospirillales bacterium]